MEQKPSSIRVAQRGIWFFMRTAVLIVAVVILAYCVFIVAIRSTNLYILATEGLQLRAECILGGEISSELLEYFTQKYVAEDNQLNGTTYDDYTITGFDYRIEVERISVLPWSDTATVTLVDRMYSINGSIHEDKKPENAPEGAEYPLPGWEDGRYHLRFRLSGGRWYVYQFQLIEAVPDKTPKPTPDMRMTPVPARDEEE